MHNENKYHLLTPDLLNDLYYTLQLHVLLEQIAQSNLWEAQIYTR